MKKLFYLFGVMLLTATVFTSCSEEDEGGNAKNLIGKWQSVYNEGWEKINGEIDYEWSENYDGLLYVFTEDGEISSYEYYSGKWNLEEQGEYIYKNGKIIIKGYEDGEYFENVCDVIKLESSTLIISVYENETYDGDVYEDYDVLTMRRADDIEL